MKNKNYTVVGMHCASCANTIERALNKNEEIDAKVNLATEKVNVSFNEKKYDFTKLKKIVQDAGYDILEDISEEEKVALYDDKIKNKEKKLKISIISAIPLLYISMGHMMGFYLPDIINPSVNPFNFAISQLILTIPIVYAGNEFFIQGFKQLLKRSPNMDSLVGVGSAAAIIYSIYVTYLIVADPSQGHHYAMELYYESAAVIITLILLGNLIEIKTKGKTSSAIKKLMDLQPKKVKLLKNGEEIETDIEHIKANDIVVSYPGDKIPVDGIIVNGTTSIDESMITGESIPVDKNVNDKVIAGSINKQGNIQIKTTEVGNNTVLSQIIQLVENAQGSKAPISRMADIVTGYFFPIVITIAILTGVFWYIGTKDIGTAMTFFISVLIIACPCSLGLATPTSIMVGTGKGAENGILIKSGEALETASKIDTVVFDKTGTITVGKPSLTDFILLNDNFEETDEIVLENIVLKKSDLLYLVGKVEKKSEHPLARAIVEGAKSTEGNLNFGEVKEFKSITGYGITGDIDLVNENDAINLNVQIGNRKLMNKINVDLNKIEDIYEKLSIEGKTPMFVALNGKLAGIVAVSDTVKESSRHAIERLNKMGITTIMLTGDNENTAKAIAKITGIKEVIAEVLPNEKADKIKKLQEKSKFVSMVGDGINDAPALAQSNIGIAIGNGTDIAIESADIVLIKSDLQDVSKAIELSKATIINIKENIFWAFIYNIIGIPIATGIFYALFNGIRLNPMVAALAMSFSSVSVVLNALRLQKFSPSTFARAKK